MSPPITFSPDTRAPATIDGNAVNWELYHRARIILMLGAFDAGASIDSKVEESDDASTWTDVPDAAFATLYEDSAGLVLEGLLYHTGSRKKFVRSSATVAGGNVTFAVLIDLTREEKVYVTPQWTVAG